MRRVFEALFVIALVQSGAIASAQNHVLTVDGQDDFALAKEIAGFGGAPAISIDVWVRAEGPADGGLLVGVLDGAQTEGWSLRATCGGATTELLFETRLGAAASTLAGGAANTFADGGWHHVAAVDDGSVTLLYLDGAVVGVSGASQATAWSLANAYVGVGGTVFQTDGFFDGAFDDVRLWTRALAAGEVASIAGGGAPSTASGLVTHYRFEGNLLDSVGDEHALPNGDIAFVVEAVGARPLVRFPGALSLAAGGASHFTLDGGSTSAGRAYFLLGSTSGTTPPLPVQSGFLPLVRDEWLLRTAVSPNTPPYTASFGLLDTSGRATCTFDVPAGTLPALAGLVFHHAALVLAPTGELELVTNAVGLTLAP